MKARVVPLESQVVPPHEKQLAILPAVDLLPRCARCGKLFAEALTRPWRIVCPRCKETNDIR